MRIIFKNIKDFMEWYNQSDTVKRKIHSKAYTVVVTPRGVELIPIIASRHLHNIVIDLQDEDFDKVLEFLKKLLQIEKIPFAVVEPVY